MHYAEVQRYQNVRYVFLGRGLNDNRSSGIERVVNLYIGREASNLEHVLPNLLYQFDTMKKEGTTSIGQSHELCISYFTEFLPFTASLRIFITILILCLKHLSSWFVPVARSRNNPDMKTPDARLAERDYTNFVWMPQMATCPIITG